MAPSGACGVARLRRSKDVANLASLEIMEFSNRLAGNYEVRSRVSHITFEKKSFFLVHLISWVSGKQWKVRKNSMPASLVYPVKSVY